MPVGYQNMLASMVDVWEQSIGFRVKITTADMLKMANAGIETYRDIGQWALKSGGTRFKSILQSMPWAQYGLDKDSYRHASETFQAEYGRVTGQDISKEAMKAAFDESGDLMTATQYAQQLMNDANIQKQYGWVKYGLDFANWTQQKLQLRTAFGRDIHDAEAATLLQYEHTSQGPNLAAIARKTGQQQQPTEVAGGGSLVR